MIKKIIVSISLLFSLTLFAQESTSSPYSFYGIGDVKFKGTVENRSMGGLSVLPDSIHMNIQNPAHYASLKLTNFAIGGTYANSKSKTEVQEGKARRTSLDYLAIAVPVGKLGIGFGLIPYSSVGYKIEKRTSATNTTYSNYTGTGGINKVFAGLGYKITKDLNIGADIQYNFGKIETTNARYLSGLDFIEYGTRENNISDVRGVNFDLGLSYQTKLNSKYSFYSSLIYSPEATLTFQNSRTIELVQFLASGAVSVVETNDIPISDTKIKLPSKLAFGSGFGEVKKWLVGGEITLLQNSVLSNRFTDIQGATFENTVRYSIGGFFIPNYNSYSNYFKRIVYRGGLRYENTGLVIQNKSINDIAGTFGMGLPLSGTFSNINIGLEIGKRGTKYYNLVQENYFNISVGLSLSDRWFVKRKYD
ncbi:hypothetical protein [Flavobacterium sp.]|uniref:hypothetical protein n=1 Tax=Flavobacterium sp. TaxID=239 RepID=UPI00248A5275|nr:hypothetical protein [Flavobacterium sp.]MDI1316483.1 hypothetical protein [Flavobacterium sp.]